MTADEIKLWGDSAMARLEKYTAAHPLPEGYTVIEEDLIFTEGELEDVLSKF